MGRGCSNRGIKGKMQDLGMEVECMEQGYSGDGSNVCAPGWGKWGKRKGGRGGRVSLDICVPGWVELNLDTISICNLPSSAITG